jgi:hypothetical protein
MPEYKKTDEDARKYVKHTTIEKKDSGLIMVVTDRKSMHGNFCPSSARSKYEKIILVIVILFWRSSVILYNIKKELI